MWFETARLRTTSPRKASRSYESARWSTHDEWVKACRRSSSGSSSSSELSVSAISRGTLGHARGHVLGRLAHREDLGRVLVRDADACVVLELHHELHEV